THTISASYQDDSSFAPSTVAPPLPQTVIPATSTPTLAAAPPSPSTFGQTVAFTATVTSAVSGTHTGNVTFSIDGTPQTPPVPLMVVNGQDVATFPDATLSGGTHMISATYNGDTNFAPSTVAAPLTQTVNPA